MKARFPRNRVVASSGLAGNCYRRLLIALIIGFTNVGIAPGQETSSPEMGGAKHAAKDQLRAQPSVLKGGVRGSALLTVDGLEKIGETAKDLRRSALAVINEVSRKTIAQIRGPNVLANGFVINPMPEPTGSIPFGDLPPRKARLDHFVTTTGGQVQLLQNEIAALIIPQSKLSDVSRPWGKILSIMQDVDNSYSKLKRLTQAQFYNNLKIAKESLRIYDDMHSLEKLRREVARLIRPN